MSTDQQATLTLKLRVTPELKEKIVQSADKFNRSMNADMVTRLESTFDSPHRSLEEVPTENLMEELSKRFGGLQVSISSIKGNNPF